MGWYLDDVRVYTCGRAPVPRSTPPITGDATSGARSRPTPGRWSPSSATLTSSGARTVDRIAGATGTSYACSGADLGKRISVRVTATAHGRHARTFSAATAPVTSRVTERRGRRRLVEQPPWPTARAHARAPSRDPAGSAGDRARRPAATGGRDRAASRRSTRSRRSWSTRRWPTSTARSTTPCRPRWPTTAVPGARVKVRFAGKDARRLRRRARRRHRPHRHAHAAAPGGQPRAGAQPGDRRARRAARRALRRHPRRRAPARGPAPPRDHREEAVAARGAGRRRRGVGPRRLAALPGGRTPSSPIWRAVARRAPSGRRCPGRTGHGCSPRRPRRDAGRRAGAACSCVPDHRDVARLDAALTAVLGAGHHVVLTAGAGPGPPLPRVPRRRPRHPADRGRHPRGRLRARPRPRAGGDLGRR